MEEKVPFNDFFEKSKEFFGSMKKVISEQEVQVFLLQSMERQLSNENKLSFIKSMIARHPEVLLDPEVIELQKKLQTK